MAFPIVEATNSNHKSTASTSLIVNLPTGIQAGDLLIAVVIAHNPGATTNPSGWTTIVQGDAPNSTNGAGNFGGEASMRVVYKVADGSEGSSITFTSTNSVNNIGMSFRITGFTGTPEGAIVGSGNAANPPNLAPSWGAEDNLWIALHYGVSGGEIDCTAAPTNYSNLLKQTGTQGSTNYLASARRELNAASEDPGTFTTTGTLGRSNDAIIAIAPAGPPFNLYNENPSTSIVSQINQNNNTTFSQLNRSITVVGALANVASMVYSTTLQLSASISLSSLMSFFSGTPNIKIPFFRVKSIDPKGSAHQVTPSGNSKVDKI